MEARAAPTLVLLAAWSPPLSYVNIIPIAALALVALLPVLYFASTRAYLTCAFVPFCALCCALAVRMEDRFAATLGALVALLAAGDPAGLLPALVLSCILVVAVNDEEWRWGYVVAVAVGGWYVLLLSFIRGRACIIGGGLR